MPGRRAVIYRATSGGRAERKIIKRFNMISSCDSRCGRLSAAVAVSLSHHDCFDFSCPQTRDKAQSRHVSNWLAGWLAGISGSAGDMGSGCAVRLREYNS